MRFNRSYAPGDIDIDIVDHNDIFRLRFQINDKKEICLK